MAEEGPRRPRCVVGYLTWESTHVMLRAGMLVHAGGGGAGGGSPGRGHDTHCWEETKSKNAQQTGLAARTVADDDEFPAQSGMSMGLEVGCRPPRRRGLPKCVGGGQVSEHFCLPADDVLSIAIICHGWQRTGERRFAQTPVVVRNRRNRMEKWRQWLVGDCEGSGLMLDL